MNGFSITGVLDTPTAASASLALQSIAAGLRERFDRVHLTGNSVEATSASIFSYVFRGRRTHPMLPFNRVRVELLDSDPQRLQFDLNYKMQLIGILYLAVAAGLLASIDSGLAKGMAIGFLFSGALFVLNYVIARHRALNWLSKHSIVGSQSSSSS